MDDGALPRCHGLAHQVFQRHTVVSIDRTEIIKAEILEIIAAIDDILDRLLGVTNGAEKRIGRPAECAK